MMKRGLNTNYVTITLTAIFLIPIETFAVDRQPSQEPSSDSGSPVYRMLYNHYATEHEQSAAQHKNQQRPNLPPFMMTMLDQGKIGIFDGIIAEVNKILFQQAAQLDLPMDFFSCVSRNPPAEKLSRQLDAIEPDLTILRDALGDLLNWLDWYPKDDWHKRFGKTGIYEHLRQLKHDLILTDSAYCYYRSRTNRRLNIEESTKSAQNLKRLQQELDKQINNTTDSIRLLLWQSRLCRTSANSDCDKNIRQLTELLKKPVAKNDRHNIKLELMRLALKKNIKVTNIDQIIEQVKQHYVWLEKNSFDKKFHNNLLQTALFESYLRQLRMTIPPFDNITGHRRFLSTREFLTPIKTLADKYPKLRSVCSDLLANRLACSVKVLAESDSQYNLRDLVKTWDDFELLALAGYYQNQNPPCFDFAVKLYQTFLETRQKQNHCYQQVLYDLGLCHYLLGKRHLAKNNSADFEKQTVSAITCWHRLAGEFPYFELKGNSADVSSRNAIALAADAAYDLFNRDAEKYGNLTINVLATLIGSVGQAGAVTIGPFSQTEIAKKYRYHYGSVLQRAHQYEKAACVFSTVDNKDTQKTAARYNAVYCRFHHYQNSEPTLANRSKIYQKCADELIAFIDDNLTDPLIVKATLLLTHIYQEMSLITPAIKAVNRTLQIYPTDKQLITAAVNLLQSQRDELLKLHAHGSPDKLSAELIDSLTLAQRAYHGLKLDTTNEMFPFAARAWLERIALASVNLTGADLPEPKQADALLARLNQNEKYNRSLWLIRCRALLAFAEGKHEDSQKMWHSIRNSTKNKSDNNMRYYWWESRYFSLRCLQAKGDTNQTAHVINVLLQTHPNEQSPWIKRLKQLKKELKTPK